MKPEGRMYQAAMQMNVLNSVITNITEVDAIHFSGRQYCWSHNRQGTSGSVGVEGRSMIQDGKYVNLGRPLGSSPEMVEYVRTSQKRQGLTEDLMVLGLADSTWSVGEPRTWGSGQQRHASFSSSLADTLRSG